MSNTARVAAVGTFAAMIWAVYASLSLDAAVARWVLAGVSVAVPLTLWTIAHRRRDQAPAKADAMIIAGLPAAMLMGAIADFAAWWLR